MWEEDAVVLILGVAGDAVARGPSLSEVQKVPFLLIPLLRFQVILPPVQSAAGHRFLIESRMSVGNTLKHATWGFGQFDQQQIKGERL